MKNVEYKIVKNVLTITVDLSKEFGQSRSGKSTTVASSEGNQVLEGSNNIKMGLNIYK